MAITNLRKRLNAIRAAQESEEVKSLALLPAGTGLCLEDQMRIMDERKMLMGYRERPLFPDVWVKGDGCIVAIAGMSQDHMCRCIALWLGGEAEDVEAEKVGVTPSTSLSSNAKVSPYDTPETWVALAASFETTPALNTMLARLRAMEGGTDCLHAMLQERIAESLAKAHAIPEHQMFNAPTFF